MRLDYVFDTVCPWCYVGKRRLQAALARRPDVQAEIVWRPFLLNPDIPLDGMDRQLYLDRKFGGSVRSQRVHAAVAGAGSSVGLEFEFDGITRMPNTMASHRLIRFSSRFGCQGEIVEAVFDAYFRKGLDIGSTDVLVEIGQAFHLPTDELKTYLESDADFASVLNDNARAHRLGVNGVPCVIVEGEYALAGAQEPDILLRLIDIARETRLETGFIQS